MNTSYQKETIIDKNIGNNAFSYDERKALLGNAEITIPRIQQIDNLDQIQLGDHIVFEEINHHGTLKSCKGLKHIYHFTPPVIATRDLSPSNNGTKNNLPDIFIFDNHNHAFYFWTQYLKKFLSAKNKEESNASNEDSRLSLIHIDQHSDLNTPPLSLTDYIKKQGFSSDPIFPSSDLIYNYTNYICNVGNFIPPFLDLYPQTQFTWIRSESQLLDFQLSRMLNDFCIIDIDLDFRAPEMSIEYYHQTIEKTKQLITNASLITIATSPYFLDQTKALTILQDILEEKAGIA